MFSKPINTPVPLSHIVGFSVVLAIDPVRQADLFALSDRGASLARHGHLAEKQHSWSESGVGASLARHGRVTEKQFSPAQSGVGASRAPQFAVSSARQPDSPRHSNTHTHFRPLMTTVGLEPTPFRTDALSQHPRPLGQTVLGAAKNHNATRSSLTIWGARKLVESASPNFWPPEPQMCKCVLRPVRHAVARVRADHPNQV